MSQAKTLKVTSNVGRDLKAAASSFKNEASTVWEYVVNSLQYVDEGVCPKVQVIIKPRLKVIEIRDNGRGMSASNLSGFFEMHGENEDRVRGRPGRGKFGTGKSAAFGIGNKLIVDTTRNGLRNVVELDREMIDESTGDDIPLDWTTRDETTNSANGTTVTIEGIFLKKLRTQPVIEYIERHLQIFRGRMPEVAVNEHVCQYREPNISEVFTFDPSDLQKQMLGDVTLTIKVSMTPLQPQEQGISITSGLGNLVAIETAGVNSKELGNYLFGEIDVLALESAESPIEPYDVTRSLQLNIEHPVAAVLIPFIGSKLESVRKEQVKKLRDAQKTEDARRLAKQGHVIADLLNEDFQRLMGRLEDIRSASARPGKNKSTFGDSNDAGSDEGVWIEGTSLPGEVAKTDSNKPNSEKKGHDSEDPNIAREGLPDEEGEAAVDPASGEGKSKKRPRGGFSVDFRSLGEDADRSRYDRTSLTILINLDHPVVVNALRLGGIDDLNFRRLAYEIAFTEYSIALGYEMADQDPDIPADDLLYEVRATLNRVSANAASLYV